MSSYPNPSRPTTGVANGVDILVAIDIGTTYTKVAYVHNGNNDGTSQPTRHIVNTWPRRSSSREIEIVPTVLSYGRQPGSVVSFGDVVANGEVDRYKWFKSQFPDGMVPSLTPGGHSRKARDLYLDFLSAIYPTIKSLIVQTISTSSLVWSKARVKFMFSVPAEYEAGGNDMRTLKSMQRLAKNPRRKQSPSPELIQIAREAGYCCHPNHTVSEAVHNEATASAAFAMSPTGGNLQVKSGENVLVVDIGGGTSDLCLLQIKDKETGDLGLGPINPVVGERLGSVVIMLAIRGAMASYLKRTCSFTNGYTAEKVISDITNSEKFQDFVCGLTASPKSSTEIFEQFKIEGVVCRNADIKGKGISMEIGSNLLKMSSSIFMQPFDSLIHGNPQQGTPGIRDQIDDFIEDLYDQGNPSYPGLDGAVLVTGGTMLSEQDEADTGTRGELDILLLSGGFGATRLMEETLKTLLDNDKRRLPEAIHDNIDNLRIMSSTKPQLCVVLGVLLLEEDSLDQPRRTVTEKPATIGKRFVMKIRKQMDDFKANQEKRMRDKF